MTFVFAVVLILHGLIHLLGFAKAFGFAELPQLTQPISPPFGVLWLIAGLLFLVAAGSLFLWPRWWWVIGACAIVVSMLVIVAVWTDAKFGALVNLVSSLASSLASLLEDRPACGRHTTATWRQHWRAPLKRSRSPTMMSRIYLIQCSDIFAPQESFDQPLCGNPSTPSPPGLASRTRATRLLPSSCSTKRMS
jgi:hypothetical protein